MNNFDEPVKKAETDAEILDALQGVKLTQDEIRRGACGGMGLAFFRAYYEKLPEEVAHRLTEIDAEAWGTSPGRRVSTCPARSWIGSGRSWQATPPSPRSSGRRTCTGGGWATLPSGRTAGRSKGRPHHEGPVPLLRLRAHGTHGAGPPHQRHVLGRPSR